MKLVLVLMVKNESAIIRRCLEAVESLVDAFCVCDTGSTDNTCEIVRDFLKTHDGHLAEVPWQNFGFNRTETFKAAQTYLRTTGWDLKDTYGLLLDADMVFVPGSLKQQELTEVGYTVVQCNGSLEYPNTRLVRMDFDWKCTGVTHEYWDGPSTAMAKSVCFIDDRNDGGCKSDKFTRDIRLLTEGLEKEPTNVRYMFYLAQSYHSIGNWQGAIANYQRRIDAGGWEEEVWYSHYMIGESYKELKQYPEFEMWMLKAHERRPSRAEPIYKLARYFRESGQHYKAYHYIQLGKQIPLSTDSLFVEVDVYKHLFEYEATIVMYYLDKIRQGCETSMQYMLKDAPNVQNVYNNFPFYIESLKLPVYPTTLSWDIWGEDFHPTSVALYRSNGQIHQNVRFVNYMIQPQTGAYLMKKDGNISADHHVRTENVWYDGVNFQKMHESSTGLTPRPNAHIHGLEDVRVYHNAQDELCFTATSWGYTDRIRIMQGRYHPTSGTYSDCKMIESPLNAECEKNWLAVDGTDDIIYSYRPLRVGRIHDKNLGFHTEHATPWFFQHLRGSAVAFRPVQFPGEVWCMLHFVEYSTPRKYFHTVLRMDSNYKPKMIALPFSFQAKTIEYCLGCVPDNGCENLICSFSTMDNMPRMMKIPVSTFQWLNV